MTTEDQEYVRLPGRGQTSSFFSRTRCTLWLARDHLLQVELSAGYQESGRRFYFRDIQSLILVKTKRWQIINLILGTLTGGLLLLTAALAKATKGSGGGEVALLIAGGIFGLILLVNLLAGPTCMCHLKTAVQEEELPSLRRLRRARKIIGRLQPLIEQAQGMVSREEVAARFQSILQQLKLPEPVPGQPLRYVSVIKPYRSRMHRILYSLLLLDALITVWQIFQPSVLVILLAMINQMALMGAVILALVKQDETDLKPALKSLTWGVGIYLLVTDLVGYIIMLSMVTTTRQANNAQWGYIQALAALKPRETPWFLDLLVFGAAVSLGLCVWGNLLLGKHWRDKAAVATGVEPPPKL